MKIKVERVGGRGAKGVSAQFRPPGWRQRRRDTMSLPWPTTALRIALAGRAESPLISHQIRRGLRAIHVIHEFCKICKICRICRICEAKIRSRNPRAEFQRAGFEGRGSYSHYSQGQGMSGFLSLFWDTLTKLMKYPGDFKQITDMFGQVCTTKSEIRGPKTEIRSSGRNLACQSVIRISHFGLPSDFGCFGFRIFTPHPSFEGCGSAGVWLDGFVGLRACRALF